LREQTQRWHHWAYEYRDGRHIVQSALVVTIKGRHDYLVSVSVHRDHLRPVPFADCPTQPCPVSFGAFDFATRQQFGH
jgi:hypothetical protein